MIITCKSYDKKFSVKDQDIPNEGRLVQCGSCSSIWTQYPIKLKTQEEKPKIQKNIQKIKKPKKIQHKDFAIQPLYSKKNTNLKKTKDKNKIVQKKSEEKVKQGFGFLNFLILLILISISTIGVFETFRDQISPFWPDLEDYLVYVYETVNNIYILSIDLIKSYQ